MGVYAFNRKVLDFVPDYQSFGFDDLMLTLLSQKQEIKAYPFAGYWLDIGRPEDFDKANQDVEAGVFLLYCLRCPDSNIIIDIFSILCSTKFFIFYQILV